MAIPNNYIDKITDNDNGESRLICPAAENVRVGNEHFDGNDLDEVLDELAGGIGEAGQVNEIVMNGQHYTPTNKVIDLGTVITQHQDISGKADKATTYTKTETDNAIANAVEGLGGGSVESVTINGFNHEPINGVVDLGNVQGEPGPKGDTGNVQVDGNGNVLIVNSLTEGGTGAALSAEMGKRLAMLSGTFAAAWAHSKAVTTPFCWLWMNETVDNSPVCKPIWHVGNSAFIDAAGATAFVEAPQSVPAAPTITMSEQPVDGKYPKGTIVTISPATNTALYYSVNGGTAKVSDVAVAITLDTAGVTISIDAYCVNQAGTSATHATQTIVVQGIPTPEFAPKAGTTIDGTVVSRGGYVVITGEVGGILHYKVNEGSYIDVNGIGNAAPSVEVQITEAKTIMAYNTIDGTDSAVVTRPYTMDALDAPTISPASGEVQAGSSVTITAPAGATLKVNGTAIASQTTTVTITTNNQTVTAVSVDAYGESVAATATYTIAVAKIKVKVNAAGTTMKLGLENGGTTTVYDFALDNVGDTLNEITIENINTTTGNSYQSLADVTFESLAFSDNTKIVEFDGGGMKVKYMRGAFQNATALTSVKGIVVCAMTTQTSPSDQYDGNLFNAFSGARMLENVELSGTISYAVNNILSQVGLGLSGKKPVVDISNLEGTTTNFAGAFSNLKCETLDISGISTAGMTVGTFANTFQNCNNLRTLIIGDLADPSNIGADTFTGTTGITTLICTTNTPPTLKASGGWLDALVEKNTSVQIKVPASAVNTYTAKQGWSTYADRISANTDN